MGSRWLVTVGGYDHDRPSSDPADYGARLADPCIALRQFAQRDDTLSDVTTYCYPVSVRRDFHRCQSFPGGLVEARDSVASYNPIYGQGMTSAALHSATLATYLASERHRTNRPRATSRLRPVINSVWTLSTTADFRLNT